MSTPCKTPWTSLKAWSAGWFFVDICMGPQASGLSRLVSDSVSESESLSVKLLPKFIWFPIHRCITKYIIHQSTVHQKQEHYLFMFDQCSRNPDLSMTLPLQARCEDQDQQADVTLLPTWLHIHCNFTNCIPWILFTCTTPKTGLHKQTMVAHTASYSTHVIHTGTVIAAPEAPAPRSSKSMKVKKGECMSWVAEF